MYTLIKGNLDRQNRALELLAALLDEEFSHLVENNTEVIMSLEFSIHELLRQITVEKDGVMRRLGGGKVLDYAQMVAEEEGALLRELWDSIDAWEQKCSRKASRNAELSLGLLDQSKEMLDYLHDRLLPPQEEIYGPDGAFIQHTPQATLISGKL